MAQVFEKQNELRQKSPANLRAGAAKRILIDDSFEEKQF